MTHTGLRPFTEFFFLIRILLGKEEGRSLLLPQPLGVVVPPDTPTYPGDLQPPFLSVLLGLPKQFGGICLSETENTLLCLVPTNSVN